MAGLSAGALRSEWEALAAEVCSQARGRVLAAPAAAEALEEVGGWQALVGALTTKSGTARKRVREGWEVLAQRVAAEKGALTLGVGEADDLLAELTPALAQIVLDAIGRFDRACERGRLLDFDSLQRLATRLLVSRADVRARVRRRYDEVFVDEAQDTSPEQWALVRAVVGDGDADGRLPARGFFAVGDGQQSIYGFRGARPEDFQELGVEADAVGGRRVRLATSYRMRSAPLALTNHLAQRLFEAPEALDAGRPDDGDPGGVELIVTDGDGEASARAERLADLVAGRLVELIRERSLRTEECALLLRSRTHLPIWEDALWRHGLPFVTAGGVGFFERREVLDLSALLAFLHDPRNDIALATVLRSPLFSVSDAGLFEMAGFHRGGLWRSLRDRRDAPAHEDDRAAATFAVEILQRLRTLAGRVPAGPLLRMAVEDTGYLAILAAAPRGDQALANVEKLISIVRTEAGPLGPLVRRLARLLSRADRESQAALAVEGREGVRVMTVHASKGLEFPVVAVADLGQRTRSSATASLYLERLRSDGPLHLAPALAGRGEDGEKTVIRLLIARQIAASRAAEEARLLYVACTRARDVLLMAATVDKARRPGGRSPLDLLRDPLALGWTEGEVAATLTADRVPRSALPEGLMVPIRSSVVATSA